MGFNTCYFFIKILKQLNTPFTPVQVKLAEVSEIETMLKFETGSVIVWIKVAFDTEGSLSADLLNAVMIALYLVPGIRPSIVIGGLEILSLILNVPFNSFNCHS